MVRKRLLLALGMMPILALMACSGTVSEAEVQSMVDARVEAIRATILADLQKRFSEEVSKLKQGPQGPRGFTGPQGPGGDADYVRSELRSLERALYGFSGAPSFTSDDIGGLERDIRDLCSRLRRNLDFYITC